MLLIWGKILLLGSLLPPSPLKVLKLQAGCSVQLLDLDSRSTETHTAALWHKVPVIPKWQLLWKFLSC